MQIYSRCSRFLPWLTFKKTNNAPPPELKHFQQLEVLDEIKMKGVINLKKSKRDMSSTRPFMWSLNIHISGKSFAKLVTEL